VIPPLGWVIPIAHEGPGGPRSGLGASSLLGLVPTAGASPLRISSEVSGERVFLPPIDTVVLGPRGEL